MNSNNVSLEDLFDNLFTMGEIRQIRGAMDGYAASMEARATAHDADPDEICAGCGHAWKFHVDRNLHEQTCDFEHDVSDPDIGWRAVMCSCEKFEPTGEAA